MHPRQPRVINPLWLGRKCMVFTQHRHGVQEENLLVLERRARWVREGGSCLAIGVDAESAAVFKTLNSQQVKRACDSTVPLFSLCLDELALENLSRSDPVSFPTPELAELVTEENQIVLANRWKAACADEIQAKLTFGMSSRVVDWLRRATWSQLNRVIQSGHTCVRLSVKPAFIFQAGSTLHLGQTQRTCAALLASRFTKPSLLWPLGHSAETYLADESSFGGPQLEGISAWEVPAFAQKFETLVQFTNRPSIIKQLLDVDVPDKLLRKQIRQVESRFSLDRLPPKGRPASFSNASILKSVRERYDTSVIYALLQLAGAAASVANGTYLDHILEIYQRYLFLTGSRAQTAAVTFDNFVEVAHSIGRGLLDVEECSTCGSAHVYRAGEGEEECPVCNLHQHVRYDSKNIMARYGEPAAGNDEDKFSEPILRVN